MPDPELATVARRSTDSSGRAIFASEWMWQCWLEATSEFALGESMVITQGAHMRLAGGGAAGSAGFHDFGGCFDLRAWHLTPAEVEETVTHYRRRGWAIWIRNLAHGGFRDPHFHAVLCSDFDLSAGAAGQVASYIRGGNGLAGGGSDYHRRPSPLVIEEDDMPLSERDKDDVARRTASLLKAELPPAVWAHAVPGDNPTDDPEVPARVALGRAARRAGAARRLVEALGEATMNPPPVNIPGSIRFGLYLFGATAGLFVIYAVAKGWAGEAEQSLVTGLASLALVLSAANVKLRTTTTQEV